MRQINTILCLCDAITNVVGNCFASAWRFCATLCLCHNSLLSAPSSFAVVVLHATGPRYANEVLCAAGPCYASEVFRSAGPCYATEVLLATGSCYAIDEIYCATPVRLTALLCVSMPMPRGTWLCIAKVLLLFAPPFQRNVSLHGFIQCRCHSKQVGSQPCRCCVNLSHQCQCDADAVLI